MAGDDFTMNCVVCGHQGCKVNPIRSNLICVHCWSDLEGEEE